MRFTSAAISGQVHIRQGFFNVPSGGVSVRGALYAFFWTSHCSSPNRLSPKPDHPLERPAPSTNGPETQERSSIGEGVLARSDDFGHSYTHVKPMPQGFDYSTAVNTAIQPDLPEEQRLGVFISGVPRYRASVPYLAYAPFDTFADPATWKFFAGRNPHGQPRWVSWLAWKPEPTGQVYTPANDLDYDVGEFSITWNRPLRMWLMMCGGVAVRVVRTQWGPWSEPTSLLGRTDHPGCRLIMTAAGCGNRRDYWPDRRHGNAFQPGGFYAPFVMNRYTGGDPALHQATLYWLLPTWNPYQVSMMRTTIEAPNADWWAPNPVPPVRIPRAEAGGHPLQ